MRRLTRLQLLSAPLLTLFAALPAPAIAQEAVAPAGTILFVCEHGTVKSLLAKLLFDQYARDAGLAMRAESRGTAPDADVPEWMRARLTGARLAFDGFSPRPLGAVDLAGASYIVTFDLPADVAGRAPGGVPRARWDSLPPASRDFEGSRAAIERRVRALVDSLSRASRVRR